MSGSGGYYKYRCKYWLTYNCPNWVWVNNAPCAHCLADGRDSAATMKSSQLHISREVFVPQIENGSLYYTLMEIVAADDAGGGWAVRDLPIQPIPLTTGPAAVSFKAIDEMAAHGIGKVVFPLRLEDPRNWS